MKTTKAGRHKFESREESFHDLDSLLAQLQDRHPIFSNVTVILSLLGIFGLLCLLGVLR